MLMHCDSLYIWGCWMCAVSEESGNLSIQEGERRLVSLLEGVTPGCLA